ncbi:ABC transporter permease, partial [Streptomyces sp. NPDC096068]
MTAVLTRRPGLSRIRATRSPLYLTCLGLVVLVTAAALLAPWAAPHDPNAVDLGDALAGPSAEHP